MPGVTSLLRSAQAAQKKIQAQQDAQIAYEYSNSAKTLDDYKWYEEYLNKRSKSVSDPSAALTLQKAKDAALKGHISNEVQRASNNIITGQGTSVDKYNKILSFYNQAQSNGMYDLAQDLDYKLGNLLVSMQGESERQQEAAIRFSEAQAKAYEKEVKAQGYVNRDMAQDLQTAMQEISNAWSKGGQAAYNIAAKKWIDGDKKTGTPSIREMLKALNGGQDVLPKDATTSIGQVLTGVADGIGEYYRLAAEATIDIPDENQKYKDILRKYQTGEFKFDTPMGKVTFNDLKAMENDPKAFVQTTKNTPGGTAYGAQLSTKFGYQIDANGNAVPVYSGALNEVTNRKQFDKALKKLGFDINKDSYKDENGFYQVKLNEKTRKWLDPKLIDSIDGETLFLEPNATGFQVKKPDGSLYNIATDRKGLGGIFKIDANGAKHIAGQYGFDQNTNSLMANISDVLGKSQKYLKAQQQAKIAADTKIRNFSTPGSNMLSGRDPAVNFAMQAVNAINNKNKAPVMAQRNDGGFNFTDARGNAISAYSYAKMTGKSFRSILQTMASKGDSFAANALKYAGDDGAYNPASVDINTAKNWNSLVWGNQIKLQTPQAARISKTSGPWGVSDVVKGSSFGRALGY